MAKKSVKAGPGWDEIGKMVGKKMEKGFKDKDCCNSWHGWMRHHDNNGGGFCGRALFAIGMYFALNSFGLLAGIPVWALWMIGIGFALMSF
jgi:hypothetical protein